MADDQLKHVFISYVRKNSQEVDKLCDELVKRGVHVWLDRREIKPGQDWQDAIREAIRHGNFVIVCFSKEYVSRREKSFAHEELTLAIEELRQYPHDRIWFIPVLLSECDVPARSIGAGKTILNLNWVPLYEDWDAGIQRILEVIRPIPVETQNLIKALNALNPDVRAQAAKALCQADDSAAVTALTAALSDNNWKVRMYAAWALDKISNKDNGK